MHLFFVASRGLTATTWYKNALGAHPDIFCSHGRDRPERGIETDELLKSPAYRADRLEYEQWQRAAGIDDYVADLRKASDGEDFLGNVHGYVLIAVMDKLSKSEISCPVANMVRHPVTFVESYTALVNHRIKEQQMGLFADRTSASEWWANQWRLLLSSLAYILMDHIRRVALKKGPLARAQMSTIRLKLLKVGAVILRNTRRVRFLLFSSYPYQDIFRNVALTLRPQPGGCKLSAPPAR